MLAVDSRRDRQVQTHQTAAELRSNQTLQFVICKAGLIKLNHRLAARRVPSYADGSQHLTWKL